MTLEQFNTLFNINTSKIEAGGFIVEVIRKSDMSVVFKLINEIKLSQVREMQLFLNITDEQYVDDIITSTVNSVYNFFIIEKQ